MAVSAKFAPKPRTRNPSPPRFRPPQLATLVDAVADGERWIHEIKHDGYRCLLAAGGGQARAYTRSGLDRSDQFRSVIKTAARVKARALIDGEIVVLDEKDDRDFS
jgi:bifunctional non-homologous end joining protein LigD